MTAPRHSDVRNLLLRQLAPDDFDRLAGAMDRFEAGNGHQFGRPGETVATVYFPEEGLASVTSQDHPMKIEVGLIGYEGLVGLPVVLGCGSSPMSTFVQMPGQYLSVPADYFAEALRGSPTMLALFLRYAQAYQIQTASTAIANASCGIEQRLARWLLMTHDRASGNDLALTHEFLAMMLGIRRPGVTVATHILEGEHAIRATRGRIEIRDRETLVQFAGRAYGMAEAEYARLIAPLSRPAGAAAPSLAAPIARSA
jgi:CRP-like cAMP-binding protein